MLEGGAIAVGDTSDQERDGGFRTLDDLGDVSGKRALVRVDLNVPMQDGQVSDDTRFRATAADGRASWPTRARSSCCSPISADPRASAVPTCRWRWSRGLMTDVLGRPVRFIDDCRARAPRQAVATLAPGRRRHPREHPLPCRRGEERSGAGARRSPRIGDFYVNDAFSAAHRAHASTEGLAHLLPAYAGRAMEAELKALEKALGNPERPVAAVVGGAKVSTKLDVLEHLVGKVDHLIIGGGMANTFLAARGVDVGKSLASTISPRTARGDPRRRRPGRLHRPPAL